MIIKRQVYVKIYQKPAEKGKTCTVYWCAREFDTLKSKKVPQSLEIGLFFCQIFIFII